jgi:acyl carrier protein
MMVADRVKSMLAAELGVEQSTLQDDSRWLDSIGAEDVELFLGKLDQQFKFIPPGFSLGDGVRLFENTVSDETLERIGTVRGLIEYVERHAAKIDALRRR